MLISQKIANNKNFLRSPLKGAEYKNRDYINELRLKILMSQKIVVDDNFIPNKEIVIDGQVRHALDKEYIYDLTLKHYPYYPVYSKLPFDSIFIESSRTSLFAEKYDSDSFVFTYIDKEGIVCPMSWHMNTKTANLKIHSVINYFEEHILRNDDPNYVETSKERLKTEGYGHSFLILEVLLLLNTSNVNIQKYTATKKELEKIPKPLHPRFSYWILDIFREKKTFTSLEEISNQDISLPSNRNLSRMHMVRGHYKTINGKLFWWNAFVRCRHNRDTHGSIEKDYALHKNE